MSKTTKSSLRTRCESIKPHRCKYLIAVIENPKDIKNVGSIIRNIDALGVEKAYIVDPDKKFPDDWQETRKRPSLLSMSVSASKWRFIKRFDSTEDCFNHLEKKGYVSVVTSPYTKGKNNVVLHEGIYTQPKLAVWFGNESYGISQEAVDRSAFCINIPMFGLVDSLNLGTASGIVLYEITKQRREYLSKKINSCKVLDSLCRYKKYETY